MESVQAEMARLEGKLQVKIEEKNIAAEDAEREAIAQTKKDEEACIAPEISEQQKIAAGMPHCKQQTTPTILNRRYSITKKR